jgi:REP element-mobilizing transposase RayT
MAHSFTAVRIHYVFSTKERMRVISKYAQPRLWAFIGGIARTNGMVPIAIGGVEDHVHALVALPAEISVAKGVQLLKAGSSKFMNQSVSKARFEWQKGYFAGSVSASMIRPTVAYIAKQEAHHKRQSFADELRELFEKHGVEFNPDDYLG